VFSKADDSNPVFVTGNANKLKEVKAILSQGGNPIEIDNQALDSQ
jgi:inosine triphosphate pyrophosphatase